MNKTRHKDNQLEQKIKIILPLAGLIILLYMYIAMGGNLHDLIFNTIPSLVAIVVGILLAYFIYNAFLKIEQKEINQVLQNQYKLMNSINKLTETINKSNNETIKRIFLEHQQKLGDNINKITDIMNGLNNNNKIGIEKIVMRRKDLDYIEVHKNLLNGKEMFIASRTFDSIKYQDVKDLFIEYLKDREVFIKILLEKEENIDKLIQFRREHWPEEYPHRLQIRLLQDKLYTCIYGNDHKIYMTPYIKTRLGDESPSLACNITDKNGLFSIYKKEFDTLWKEGIEKK